MFSFVFVSHVGVSRFPALILCCCVFFAELIVIDQEKVNLFAHASYMFECR